jgi:hypothetical protein
MARQLLSLDPEPFYRAVIFYKYSGLHSLPLQTYTDPTTGQRFDYHRVSVFGPYEKPGPARAMVKREIGYADKGYSNFYDYSQPMGQRTSYPVSDVQGHVEIGVPSWGIHTPSTETK